MKNVIFVSYSRNINNDKNIRLLVLSIRKFSGTLSNSPIWIMVENSTEKINPNTKKFIETNDVTIDYFRSHQYLIKLPLSELIFASSTAEELVDKNIDLLIWLDSNTIILKEPTEFLLNDPIKVGYKTVHHTLIGSLFENEIDGFWKLLYEKFGILDKHFFPMKTHVDNDVIRPFFNAGCLAVSPKDKIFREWIHQFNEIAFLPEFNPYYEKNVLYEIFIHQAILSCIILYKFNQEDMKEFSFKYNFPLHLYSNFIRRHKFINFNELCSVRFESEADIVLLLSNIESKEIKEFLTLVLGKIYDD